MRNEGQKKALFLFLAAVLCGAAVYGQSANPFSGSRWQGRISYRDVGGISRSELYELILVPNGTCIVTVSGKLDRGGTDSSADVFQDADGLWSFDDEFFRLECDFSEPVFEHIPGVNWTSVYQFDALKNRFTLLVKPYPGAKFTVKAAFVRTDD
ncbi:MAG: hypothetical protein LBP37_00930 [Spirochaetaceae bacterium]|jgi:hypothetical protein|nr:hypothetical protein [Spirochaetaceae bacterium]